MNKDELIKSYFAKIFKHADFHIYQKRAILFFIKGAILLQSVIPTYIGRTTETSKKRHGIKRVHRLIKNPRITRNIITKVLLGVFKLMIRKKSKITLVIDWTTIRSVFNFFFISLETKKGRTIPIFFVGYKTGEIPEFQSQPKLEYEALKTVFSVINKDKKVTIVGDRGFDRPEFLEFIDRKGYLYLIRVSVGSRIYFSNGRNRILQRSFIKIGERRTCFNIKYTKERRVKTNLYCIWEKNYKEPWFLLSNTVVKLKIKKIARDYTRRMQIEQMFKSMKNETLGFDFKQARLRHFDRWFRYIFFTTIVFQFLAYVGTHVEQIDGLEREYTMSSKPPKKQKRSFSFYKLAVLVLHDMAISLSIFESKLHFKTFKSSWVSLE